MAKLLNILDMEKALSLLAKALLIMLTNLS